MNGWTMSDWSVFEDPTTDAERKMCATRACGELGFPFTTVVDDLDDSVAVRWSAWPERLVVVSKEGRIVYTGNQGPFGFNPGGSYEGFGEGRKGISLRGFLEAWLSEDAAETSIAGTGR